MAHLKSMLWLMVVPWGLCLCCAQAAAQNTPASAAPPANESATPRNEDAQSATKEDSAAVASSPSQRAARELIAQLDEGNFAAATESFDATMKRVLPADQLEGAWNTVTNQVGKLREQGEITVKEQPPYQIVDVSCSFERGERIVRVTFQAEKIAGLFFLPTPAESAQPRPLLLFTFAVAVLIELGAPLLLALYLRRTFQCRWRFLWIGAAVFFLFQGVTRIPAVTLLQAYPPFQQLLTQPLYKWLYLVFLCVTAGLFEESGRVLAFRFVIAPEDRNWRMAMMYGAGHGGLEAVGVGVIVFLSLLVYLAILFVPPSVWGDASSSIDLARGQFAAVGDGDPLLGAWERVCTLAIHMALSLMVLQAFLRSRLWWWGALAAHALVNLVGVGTLQLGTTVWGRSSALLATEGVLTIFGGLSLWFIVWMYRHEAAASRAAQNPGQGHDSNAT